MNEMLQEFDKNFTPENGSVAVTWLRDVKFTPATEDLIPWGMMVPDPLDDPMKLEALKLKWLMDADECFYIGDKEAKLKGLFDFPERFTGSVTLLSPHQFAQRAVSGNLGKNDRACKWLEFRRLDSFTYDPDRIVFPLQWPKLTTQKSGAQCYMGGIGSVSLVK